MLNETDMIQALLSRGVDINAVNDVGDTLLHVAVQYGSVPLVKLLLPFNPHVGKRPDSYGSSLRSAVQGNHIEIARLLLSHNADRLPLDFMGSIPLHHVCSPEMVDLLLEDLSVQQLSSVDGRGHPPGSAFYVPLTAPRALCRRLLCLSEQCRNTWWTN
jgi:ankyrin repeat protein